MTTHAVFPEHFAPQFQTPNPAQRQTHELKIWPACFAAVIAGNKPFDVRENDQNFQVGDMLILREFDPAENAFTGHAITRWVSYVLQGGSFGVQPDWCVLGFSELPPIPAGQTDIRVW